MSALKNYCDNYRGPWGIEGPWGSSDPGILPDSTDNCCSHKYVGFGMSSLLLVIENYLTGLLWNYFMRNS